MKRLCFFLTIFLTSTAFPTSIRTPYRGINFNLGQCSASVFFQKEQDCKRTFFETIWKKGKKASNCSIKYEALRNCVLQTFEECLKDSLVEYFLGRQHRERVMQNYLLFVGSEEHWCRNGGISIPLHVYEGTHCSFIYPYAANDCVANYQTIFNNSRASAWRLCREYNLAKTCLLRNLIQHCSFSNRPLMQMIEIMIEVEYDYQPFCPRAFPTRSYTYTDLQSADSCPPYSHADVIFLADVSKGTSNVAFQSMKNLIRKVASKLNYGMSGVKISLVQFHDRTDVTIRMNRFASKRTFLRGVNRVRRIYTNGKHRRLTGKSLLYLINHQLNLGESSSIIRPYHTPLLVMLTTGSSNDNSEEDGAIRTLISRKVHVVRLGPSYRSSRNEFDVKYHVDSSTDFSKYSNDVLYEICQADSIYRSGNASLLIEDRVSESNSVLSRIRRLLSRFSATDLSLLWVPKPLERVPFTLSNNSYGLSAEKISPIHRNGNNVRPSFSSNSGNSN